MSSTTPGSTAVARACRRSPRRERTGSRSRFKYRATTTTQNQQIRGDVRDALAEAAGVDSDDVSVQAVSASWGETVTKQAVKALIVFIALVMIFIAIRFELLMALAAIIAMLHDVLISVGIYSVFGLVVTPATVIAFLTILGFSLYDTIVVFDKVRENRARYAGSHLGYPDITNISMNQVLMRSLNTSIAAVLPVLSLLVVGTWILGVETLREFSLALMIGMIIGVYSSIFIATPLLAMIREPHRPSTPPARSCAALCGVARPAASGARPGCVVARRPPKRNSPRRRRPSEQTKAKRPCLTRRRGSKPPTPRPVVDATPETLLQHAPRPRKKKRTEVSRSFDSRAKSLVFAFRARRLRFALVPHPAPSRRSSRLATSRSSHLPSSAPPPLPPGNRRGTVTSQS